MDIDELNFTSYGRTRSCKEGAVGEESLAGGVGRVAVAEGFPALIRRVERKAWESSPRRAEVIPSLALRRVAVACELRLARRK